MWFCDACQEINDDNVTVCTRCGRPFRADDLDTVPRGVDKGDDVPVVQGEICVPSQLNPVPVYLILALISMLNVIPVLIHGASFRVIGLGISSCACLWVATYNLRRDVDLMFRGVKTQGTVLSIDYVVEGGRRERGVYFTNVEFMVAGKSYSVRSEYETTFQLYEVGGAATVWYDRGDPGLAVLGSRLAYQHLVLLAVGAVLCFFAYNGGPRL